MQSQDQEPSNDYVKGDQPTSLVNITATALSTRIAAIPEDVLCMKEADLEKHADVHDVERKLRAAWQMEYERAVRTENKMEASNVYKGVVTHMYFYRYILTNSFKLAYIIKPFPEYEAQLEDMLQLGLDERRKILKRPLVDKEGKFDHKLAALKEAITKNLEERRRGAVTQRLQVDQKSMNVNITKDVTQSTPGSMEAIEARLRELESGEAIAIEYKDSTDGAERQV